MPLAVNVDVVAIPLEFVVALRVAELFANVPLAPLPGAVNVTVTPLTGLPPASFTVACSAVANAALMVALCPEPAVAVTLAAPPVKLVKLKLAGLATPPTLAVTV